MENYETIIAVLGAAAAGYAKIRAFERAIISEVDNRIGKAFKDMDAKLDNKADRVAAARIEQTVSALSSEVTDFIRRQDKHIETLYAQDHEMSEQITQLRIKVGE